MVGWNFAQTSLFRVLKDIFSTYCQFKTLNRTGVQISYIILSFSCFDWRLLAATQLHKRREMWLEERRGGAGRLVAVWLRCYGKHCAVPVCFWALFKFVFTNKTNRGPGQGLGTQRCWFFHKLCSASQFPFASPAQKRGGDKTAERREEVFGFSATGGLGDLKQQKNGQCTWHC